jgi:hypothetical protein
MNNGFFRVIAIVTSDTINSKQIFINDDDEYYYTKTRKIINVPIGSTIGLKLLSLTITGNIDGLYNELYKVASEFTVNSLLYVRYSGATNENIIGKLTKTSKSGSRYYTLNDRNLGFLTASSFIKSYKLAGKPKTIPYTNYNTNDSGDKNCVLNYVESQYPKVSKKIKDQFFNAESVEVNKIIDFCDKYDIKCNLYDIIGKLKYTNEKDSNKHYKDFVGILCNNHFYPYCGTGNASRFPQLSEEKTEYKKVDCHDNIIIQNNEKFFSNIGEFDLKEDDEELNDETEMKIENAFFKNITPNFTFHSDNYKLQSLFYVAPDMADYNTNEYDLKKAYYNMALNIIKSDEQCPVFSVKSIWEKYEETKIYTFNYYLIKKKSLKKLSMYGIMTNIQPGYIINFLLNKNMITLDKIKYEKKAEYTLQWSTIQNRIERLKETLGEKIKDEYIFYNGILGRTVSNVKKSIFNLTENEINLLNADYTTDKFNDEWYLENMTEIENIKNEGFFKATKTTNIFKYINTSNIYDFVVGRTALFMLENMFDIFERYENIKLLKVKVDCLVFDKPVEIKKENKEYFKILTNDQINKKVYNIDLQYINGKKLIKNIMSEITDNNDFITYQGAPGTGKTYKIKNEYKYDISTTTTNLCLLNIMDNKTESKTVYTLLSLYDPSNIHKTFGKLRNKTIWLDEFSMVPASTWGFFFVLAKVYKCKLIITGDINQTPPIGEKRIDLDNIFFKLLFINVKTLTQDFRNDKEIIKLRDIVQESENEGELNMIFNDLYSKDDFIKYDRHLSFTHETKNIINYLMKKERKFTYKWTNTKGAVHKVDNKEIQTYKSTLDVSNGVLLSCKRTFKSVGLYKNDLWEVVEKSTQYNKKENRQVEGYILKNKLRECNNIFIQMNHMLFLELGYCSTVHSSQGLTLKENFCIHDIQSMIYVDKSILYTAITRGTEYKNMHLYKNSLRYKQLNMTEKDLLNYITTPWAKVSLTEEEDEFNKYENVKIIKY